jgi:hypothetical protein
MAKDWGAIGHAQQQRHLVSSRESFATSSMAGRDRAGMTRDLLESTWLGYLKLCSEQQQ